MTTTIMADTVFKVYADEAAKLGRAHGLRDRADYVKEYGYGPEEAQEKDCLHDLPNPLSGEWVGDLTPGELMYRLGLVEVDEDDEDALCDIFEEAHSTALFGLN